MSIDNSLKVTKSEGTNYEPIPEGSYQVQIVDVKQVERQTQYGLKQKFQFYCAVTDDEEYKGRLVFVSVNISWFNGVGGKKSSSLFNLIKTIYAFSQPKTKVAELDGLSGEDINNLVGKQFIAVVKVSDDNKWNNVTDYMKIKKEIPYEHKGKDENAAVDIDDISV